VNRYNPDIHHRRSIRLKGFDYSRSGAYFITICVRDRECLFGEIMDGEMEINQFGQLVESVWNDLPSHYPHLSLDRFVVMPNHIHGIVIFDASGAIDDIVNNVHGADIVGAGLKPAPTEHAQMESVAMESNRHGLPEIVRTFKTFSARRINEIRNIPGVPVWQRNYYEHVIRDEADYNRMAEYISTNPQRWLDDKMHPANFPVGAGLKPAHIRSKIRHLGLDEDDVADAVKWSRS